MSIESIGDISEELLVKRVAERVVQVLAAQQRRLLVIFTGSDLGLQDALSSLKALKTQGFTLQILFSSSAAHVMNVEEICSMLEPETVWMGQMDESTDVFVDRFDTILVPSLTVRTAAQVCSCTTDTPVSAVLLEGLMKGKKIIAAIDGCCPDNPVRAERGYCIPQSLKGRLRENIETLRSYGVIFSTAKGLADKTERAIDRYFWLNTKDRGLQTQSEVKNFAVPARLFEGRVLGGSFIRGCEPDITVHVSSNTLVTQFATDEARKRNICIATKE